ncbi:MAG: VOC family protein [Desulfovibrionaceae bacterium]|jgi:catechol 2,3-dioxygenase-like lactoylglutathione lyase family enzyme|nr:VOC family protein [Desulfovibrionaceae bacterium]
MGITFSGPAILVRDMTAARGFYENLLDQTVLFEVGGAYVAYVGGLCLWQVEGALSMIRGWEGGAAVPESGPGGMELYFEAEDVDGAWARMAAAGVRAVHPVLEQPWSQRCFRVLDPEDRLIEVAEPMGAVARRLLESGLTPEEVAARTMLPVAMVRGLGPKD